MGFSASGKTTKIKHRMALDILTATQRGTCAIPMAERCVYIPDLSGNVTAALGDMRDQVKAMSDENIPSGPHPILGKG